MTDIVVATTGLVMLIEATRRSVGCRWPCLRPLFIAYTWRPLPARGPQHNGASLSRLLSNMWLTTEACSVSRSAYRPGRSRLRAVRHAARPRRRGNYMMPSQLRRSPSARGAGEGRRRVVGFENGMISGVCEQRRVGGHLHDPLMKKAGYGGVKAGAIETMSSVMGRSCRRR